MLRTEFKTALMLVAGIVMALPGCGGGGGSSSDQPVETARGISSPLEPLPSLDIPGPDNSAVVSVKAVSLSSLDQSAVPLTMMDRRAIQTRH